MAESPDLGILITDTSLVIRSWDRWLEAATGVPAEFATGRPLAELAPGFEARGFLQRFQDTIERGSVQVLSPALHRYLIPCSPRTPSPYFTHMQQRVHVGPLIDGRRIEGVIVTIADVTSQLDTERRLAADLASEDPEARRAAADAVARAGKVESLEPFTEALNAQDWRVRRDAVRSLAQTADREVLNGVVETLRREHRSFNALSSALKLLAMSDVGITAPLVELLKDDDADLRIQAALALGEQQDLAAVDALLEALNDPDQNVRFHAIEALGRLRASDAVDRLAEVVESGDFFLAFAAIDALALINDRRVGPRLAPLLGDDTLRDAAAAALGTLGDDDAVAPLVETLNRAPSAAESIATALATIERRVRREIGDSAHVAETVRATITEDGERHLLDAIDRASPEALPPLVRVVGWLPGERAADTLARLLGHSNVRDAAVDSLVQRGEAAVDLLIARLDGDDSATTLAAVNTLGRLGSRRATHALLPLLDETPDLAIAAAGALARIGDPAAFDGLLAAIGHSHAAVRQAVVGALNSIGHGDMAGRVAALLDDEDPLIRESAVRIAGYFGYDNTAAALIARTRDREENVRAAAVEHLPFVDDPTNVDVAHAALEDPSPKVRAAGARALGRFDEPQVHAALLRALGDRDLWVRYYAARALGDTRDADAVPALSASAAADRAPHVRIAALDALGAIGDESALPTLIARTADTEEDVAAAALRALGRLRRPDSLTPLQNAVRSDSTRVRLAAVAGLAAHREAAAVEALAWVAATDRDSAVTDAAIAGLAEVAAADGPAAAQAVDVLLELHGDAARADAASTAIGRLGARGAERVARGLQHAQADVRRRTIETLARLRTAEATRFIGTALEDPADAVRETAVLALARLGARGYRERLATLAREDQSKAVRRVAAAAARSYPAS